MSFALGANESDGTELQKCAKTSSSSQPRLCSQNADSKFVLILFLILCLGEKLNYVTYLCIWEWSDLNL